MNYKKFAKKLKLKETNMLWVDKYRPNDLSKLDYHTDLAKRLETMVNNYVVKYIYNLPSI